MDMKIKLIFKIELLYNFRRENGFIYLYVCSALYFLVYASLLQLTLIYWRFKSKKLEIILRSSDEALNWCCWRIIYHDPETKQQKENQIILLTCASHYLIHNLNPILRYHMCDIFCILSFNNIFKRLIKISGLCKRLSAVRKCISVEFIFL